MRLKTIAELKHGLHQLADDMPLMVYGPGGNVYAEAEWEIIGGALHLSLRRKLEPEPAETVAALNAELVEGKVA